MDGYKQMIDDKSRDTESSALKPDASKKSSGGDEETLAAACAQFDPRAMEAFLKYLETELIDSPADAYSDEPTNGWPGYPFL